MRTTLTAATVLIAATVAPHAQISWETSHDAAAQAQVDTVVRQEAPMAATTPAEMVKVKLPTGVVQVPNSPDAPWYKSEQLSGYKNFYYDPATSTYVVYANPQWEGRLKNRWDESGKPTGTYIPAAGETAADRKPAATDEVKPVAPGEPAPAPLTDTLQDADTLPAKVISPTAE